MYAVYVYGVLVDNGGDCCHGVTAASGYGLYIGLDSGSSAGVTTGYTQNSFILFHDAFFGKDNKLSLLLRSVNFKWMRL